MPQAVNDTYSGAAGATLYAGRLEPSTVPAWLPASGSWGAIANTQFDQSGVGWPTKVASSTGEMPYGDFTAVIYAWGGAVPAYNGVNHQGTIVPGLHLVIAGAGGHHDWSGNEGYGLGPFDIPSETPTWRRLYNPTVPAVMNTGRGPNNEVVSAHTYDLVQPLPNYGTRGGFVRLSACGYFDIGYTHPAIDVFDNATNAWSPAATASLPFMGSDTNYAQGGYNPATGKVSLIPNSNGSRLWTFDEATLTCASTPFSNDPAVYASNSKGCVDSARNIFLQMRKGTAGGGVQAVNLNSIPSGGTPSQLATSGTAPTGTIFAMEWMPDKGKALVWAGGSGALYTLTPPATTNAAAAMSGTWAWATLPVSGAMSSTDAKNGIYGRFRYFPVYGGFVVAVVNATSDINVYRF